MTAGWRTGLVWRELFMWRDTSPLADFLPLGRGLIEPDEPAENPATKRRIKNLLNAAGITEQLTPVKPRAATLEQLAAVHDPCYMEAIQAMIAKLGGDAHMDQPVGEAPFGPGGFEIAALAAGGVIGAVDAVVAGQVRNAKGRKCALRSGLVGRFPRLAGIIREGASK
jgi:acetoin utilization deacetylase AcuC-like enzyme